MSNPSLFLGISELCAVVAVFLGTAVLRPRMWIVDRLGAPARRWIPAFTAATVTMAGPQLVLAAAAPTLPPRVWPLSAITILFLAGLSVLSAPFIGSLRTVGVTLLLYFAANLTTQIAPATGPWSPLAFVAWPHVGPPPPGKLLLAVAVSSAAIVVTIHTLGQTMHTWTRQFDKEP